MPVSLKKTLLLLISLSLSGCFTLYKPWQTALTQPTANQRPAWINNPQMAGKIVGLGHSGLHFNGRAAQRELATRRALDEIARQIGVTVSNSTVINQQLTGVGSSTSMTGNSLHQVGNKMVNAIIKDEWQEGDILYILMVAE